MNEKTVKKVVKTAPPIQEEVKKQGRPVKDVSISDIRIKLMECQELCQKYKKGTEKKYMLAINRVERDLRRLVLVLKGRGDDQD